MQEIQTKGALSTFKNDATFMEAAKQFGPNSQQEWDEYPMQGGFNPYPDNDQIAIQFLKWWIQNQTVDVQLRAPGWQSKKTLSTLKNTLTPAVEYKLSLRRLLSKNKATFPSIAQCPLTPIPIVF